MRKILVLMVALMMVLLMGCTDNTEGVDDIDSEVKFAVDEDTYRLGIMVLEVIDSVLDGSMSYESAHSFLSRLNRQMREAELTHPQQRMNNLSIYVRIGSVMFILEHAEEDDEQALESIVGLRNIIVEFLEERNVPVMTVLPIHEATYSIGTQALDAIDSFFNGDISVDIVSLTLHELDAQAGEFEISDRLERTIHFDVSQYLFFIRMNAGAINDSLQEGTRANIEEFGLENMVEYRNSLAELLGKETLPEMPQISDLILE